MPPIAAIFHVSMEPVPTPSQSLGWIEQHQSAVFPLSHKTTPSLPGGHAVTVPKGATSRLVLQIAILAGLG